MSVPEHRQMIDKLDARIVRLLNERTRHVLAIGDIKLKAGEEIYAPHRERAVFERVSRFNRGPMTNEQLRAVYREIMSSALALEKTMTIAYFGREGSGTHQAALRKFGASLEYSRQKTIADVFREVGKKRADYGVVPVDHFAEGIITHTLDLFVDSDLKIVSEIMSPAPRSFAGIQDNTAKAGRFLVLGRQGSPPTGDDRTSLLVGVTDEAGALRDVTAVFRRCKINLTQIESRPGRRKAREYFFFIDCEGHAQDRDVARAIQLLGKHSHFVKVLGSYPNTDWA
ncbi:MAG: chorismate mutase [Verrucomicrobiota bacterium]|jgi:chorismate mutase-like protein